MEKILNIKFEKTICADMLQGLENNNIEILDDEIFIFFGFNGGIEFTYGRFRFNDKIIKKMLDKSSKITKHKRGFFNSIYKYSIKENKWYFLSLLPISKRHSASSIKIDNKIYIWGGYSYTPLTIEELSKLKILPQKKNICTYSDGICFEKKNNKYLTTKIFSLPYPITNFKIIKHKNKIYFSGGAIYDRQSFDTELKINGYKIGQSFFSYELDKNNNIIETSLNFINNFKGTDRVNHIFFEHNNFLYIMGGSSTINKINKNKGYEEKTPTNVIDNWKYNIEKNEWIKLKDTPFLLVQNGFVKYKEKYIILLGGVKFNNTKYYDKIINENKFNFIDFKLKFNGITNIKELRDYYLNRTSSYNHYFSSLIIIYDIEKDKYYLQDEDIGLNINNPSLILNEKENEIFLIGSEANASLINNTYYGIQTGINLKLKIINENDK